MQAANKVVAFIDLGTNSIRLLLVKLSHASSYHILRQHKITVRLGEGEFKSGYLTDEARHRTIEACRGFREIALSFGAEEIIGYATAATRDAKNRDAFLEQLQAEVGIQFEIISGNEEARLIWLGIVNKTTITQDPVLFIDIGGGSTELIVGNQHNYSLLHSLSFGAIRTTTQFFSNPKAPIPDAEIKHLKKSIFGGVASIARKIEKCNPVTAIGSSGTIIALERLAQKMQKVPGVVHQQGILTRKELKSLCSLLAGLSHDDRSLLPNMNKDRADIIVAGSQILYGIMKACNIHEIQTTEFGLRDGMLIDYLSRCPGFLKKDGFDARGMSIQRLAQIFHADIEHTNHVSHLAAQFYDSACSAGLLTYDAKERELLIYAARVHDVGHYISFSRHHIHSAYIVQNAGMVGFSELEILIIALLCRYHRRRSPREKDPGYCLLPPGKQRTVLILSFMLRFAEALDRSHDGRVDGVSVVQAKNDDKEIQIIITTQGDCTLEVLAVQEDFPLFNRAFSREVKIFVQNSSTMPD